MSGAALADRAGAGLSARLRTVARPSIAAAGPRDAFPHTKRPLPWILAAFVTMLFFVPIAATEMNVHLPVDSRIDRFAVILVVLAWVILGGDQRAFMRTPRGKLYVAAACVFFGLAVASLLLDAG